MAKTFNPLKIVDNSKKLLKGIDLLLGMELLVGIPEEAGAHKDENGDYTSISNAAIGFIMENGEPANNLPPRPFLVPGVRKDRDNINRYLKQAGDAALEGNKGRMVRAYNAAGISASSAVKNQIQTGNFEPLKERTVYRRQHRKVAPRDSSKPLMDTLQLLKSVTYVLKG